MFPLSLSLILYLVNTLTFLIPLTLYISYIFESINGPRFIKITLQNHFAQLYPVGRKFIHIYTWTATGWILLYSASRHYGNLNSTHTLHTLFSCQYSTVCLKALWQQICTYVPMYLYTVFTGCCCISEAAY